jgi:glycosyltransferase involved in cell wall biosynthesis
VTNNNLAFDKRLLIISNVGCPPPYEGSRTRAKALLREIKLFGYEIHFASVAMAEEERAATLPYVDEWVGDFAWNTSKNLKERIRKALSWRGRRVVEFLTRNSGIDRVFFPLWFKQAVDLQRRRRYRRVLVSYVFHSRFLDAFPDANIRVIDTHDVFTYRRERLQLVGDLEPWHSFTPREEAFGLKRANRVIAIHEKEASFFRSLSIPNVYTVGHFLEENAAQCFPRESAVRVGFVGANISPNRHALSWFLDHVWPLVTMTCPEVVLVVAGGICAQLPASDGICPLGEMADLGEFYRQCSFLINPIQAGTGLKIKTVEALANGRCIVTTACGAEGTEGFCNRAIIVRDSAREFAEGVTELLKCPELARRLGQDASLFVADANRANRVALATLLASAQEPSRSVVGNR